MNRAEAATIWDGKRFGITVGSVALVFLAAIEAMAITTVMPVIAADLHGQVLYAVAFSGTLATSVIGMVGAGAWNDLKGPRAPLTTAVALFSVGLVVSGVAPDMYTFVAGRLIQGLGAGGQIVSLYVLVARVYPGFLHGKVFAAFAAAWVVPSMVGPFLAGAVAELSHWRWIFLGVVLLTAAAFLLVTSRLRGVPLTPDDETPTVQRPTRRTIVSRMGLAAVVAVSAVSVGFAAETPPRLGWVLALLCVAVIGVAIRPLLPAGTLSSRAGLPSVILIRGLLAGAFFASEAYIPKLLIEQFDFRPTTAGLALTLAALGWSFASFLQGRYGDRLGNAPIVTISLALLVTGVGLITAVAVLGALPWLVMLFWGFAGCGMGFLYPRLSVLTLAYSTPSNEGFNSAALSIADSVGSAITIAVAGLAFLTVPLAGSGFAAVFGISAAVLLACLLPGLRMGNGEAAQRAI